MIIIPELLKSTTKEHKSGRVIKKDVYMTEDGIMIIYTDVVTNKSMISYLTGSRKPL